MASLILAGVLLVQPGIAPARSIEDAAVRETLAKMIDSFENKDLDTFNICIAPRFLEQNPEIPGRVQAFFEQFDNIDITYKIASVNIADDIATVKLNWTKTMNNPMNNWHYRDVGKNVVMYFSAFKPFPLIGLEESNVFGVSFLLQTRIVVPMATAKLEEARKELEIAERKMALQREAEEREQQRREERDRMRREKLKLAEERREAREKAKTELIRLKMAEKAKADAEKAKKLAEQEAIEAKERARKEALEAQAKEAEEKKETSQTAESADTQKPLTPEELAQIAKLIKMASATYDEPVSVPLDPDAEERIRKEIERSTDTRAHDLIRKHQKQKAALEPATQEEVTESVEVEATLPPGFTSWREEKLQEIRTLNQQAEEKKEPVVKETPVKKYQSPDDIKLAREIRQKTDTHAIRILADKEQQEKTQQTQEPEIEQPPPEETKNAEEEEKRRKLEQAQKDALMRSKALQAERALAALQSTEKQPEPEGPSPMEAAREKVRQETESRIKAERSERKQESARKTREPQDVSIDIATLRQIEERAEMELEVREKTDEQAKELLLKRMIPDEAQADEGAAESIAVLAAVEETPEPEIDQAQQEAIKRAKEIKKELRQSPPSIPQVFTNLPPSDQDTNELAKTVEMKADKDADKLRERLKITPDEPELRKKALRPAPSPAMPADSEPHKTPERQFSPEELKKKQLMEAASKKLHSIHDDLGITIVADSDGTTPGEESTATPGQAKVTGKDEEVVEVQVQPIIKPDLRRIFGAQQPGGPNYDFLMSKYEVTNEEFCRFLNDAKANQNHPRGRFMYFDDKGNVFMDSTKDKQEKLFSMTNLDFKGKQPGIRYVDGRYTPVPGKEKHPTVGVSWYGALKYCNWLTLSTGYGETDLCYAEGVDPVQWHPLTVSDDEWLNGFSDIERRIWVDTCGGFRLPMNNYDSKEGAFNEFYLAAAWNGEGNTAYGFGRDDVTAADANYKANSGPYAGSTTPVGYYDGSLRPGDFETNPNQNMHGIFDLSGNVWEWGNDTTGNISYRLVFGGSFEGDSDSLRTSYRGSINPYNTCANVGIRLLTSGKRELSKTQE